MMDGADLTEEMRAAIQSFADEQNIPFDDAVKAILADWLIGHGYLEFREDDD